MRSHLLLLIALVCALTISSTLAAVETGSVSSDGFAFLGKFCFKDSPNDGSGTIDVEVTAPVFTPNSPSDLSNLLLVLYDDQEDWTPYGSWARLQENWDTWTCQQKVANSIGGWLPYNGMPGRDATGINATSITLNPDGTTVTISFQPPAIFEKSRPRYWFFSLARCNGGFNSLSYRTHAIQLDESAWNREFGVNENGLNTLYLAFFFLYSILIITNCIGTYRLQKNLSYLHPMIKLFLISLILEYLSTFVLLLHYGSYASNGTGIVMLMKLGQVLAIISRCFLMLLLLLLAKGWTISNETLTHKWAVVGVVLAYLGVDIFILVWSYAMDDPMRTTPTRTVEVLTILLNLVWLVFAFWFSFQVFYYSYRTEENPAKKSMYLKLGLLFTPWFFLPPLVSFAVFALNPWNRERVVAFLSVSITSAAYAILVFLFWPSRAEEYFSIATPDVMGSSASEDYAHL